MPHAACVTQHEAVLVGAFRRAADSAYAAVADPAEGTVLTVARAAADAVAALGPGHEPRRPRHRGGRRRRRGAGPHARAARGRWPAPGSSTPAARGLVVILDALVETVTGVRRDPGPSALPHPARDVGDDMRRGRRRVRGDVPPRRRGGRRCTRLRSRLAELGDSRRGRRRRRALERPRAHRRRRRGDRGRHRGRTTAPDPGHRPAPARPAERRRPSGPRGRAVVAVAHGPGTAALLEATGATVVRAHGQRRAVDRRDPRRRRTAPAPTRSCCCPASPTSARWPRRRPSRPARDGHARLGRADPLDRADARRRRRARRETRRSRTTSSSMTRAAGGHEVRRRLGRLARGGDERGPLPRRRRARHRRAATSSRSATPSRTSRSACSAGCSSTGGELVTLVRGDEADEAARHAVARRLRREHHGVEVVVYDGGQPFWPLILGVE